MQAGGSQIWKQLVRGELLTAVPEQDINWYLVFYLLILHLVSVGGADIFWHMGFVDPDHFTPNIRSFVRLGYWMAAPYLPVLAFCWWSRRTGRCIRMATYFLLAYAGATHAFLMYVFGILTSPLLLIFTSDIAIAFLLYRSAAISFFVLGWGNLLLFLAAVLSAWGYIPYAPIYEGTAYTSRLSTETFALFFSVVLIESLLTFWITFYAERARKSASETARLLDQASQSLSRTQVEASMGRELSTLAHELRNPLAAARSIVESTLESLRQNEGKLSAEDVEDLALALREQKRGLDLVGSLRNLARGTSLPSEQVNLNSVVQDAQRVLQALHVPGQAGIRMELSREPLFYLGSHAETMQIILNLVRNALDASPATQPIVLQTGCDEDGHVVLRCRDGGEGISAGNREKIFEPLFTTKEVGKGTGLGLSHSRELARRRGGSLVLEWSEVGRGSTFALTFPASTGKQQLSASPIP